MFEEMRGYVQLASGLTEVTTARAKELAQSLLGQGKAVVPPDVVGQVQGLADELVETSRTNRELLVGLVRTEVDRAVGRMGFVREDELAALRRHVQRLESELADLQGSQPKKKPVKKSAKKPAKKPTAAKVVPEKKKKRVVKKSAPTTAGTS
jgi:polyhydroxyalkanoate synthesis regulator phasin